MKSMCIACHSQLPNWGNGLPCDTCHQMSNLEGEKGNSSYSPDAEVSDQFDESYSENEAKIYINVDDSSPYDTPLSGFESCSSNFDVSQSSMSGKDTSLLPDYCAQHGIGRSEEHLKELENKKITPDLSVKQSHDNVGRGGSEPYMLQENTSSSDLITLGRNPIGAVHIENCQDSNNESGTHVKLEKDLSLNSLPCHSDGSSEVKKELNNQPLLADPSKSSDHSAQKTKDVDHPPQLKFEANPLIWKPPEPENPEEDTNTVVSDDDDNYGDGTKWNRRSSLSAEEERLRAMMGALHGQLKILVSRFLAMEGISMCAQEGCKSWLDIVTSLSWEAALLIKPDANEGEGMDPCPCVKVKCIASGKPHESQVIKGLVFKKNTAHKHMTTNIRNPKLLLLEGALGSEEGFSSFSSMNQENDHLKWITDMIAEYEPNVILVEKTVRRDILEFIQGKNITLVYDMKLHRLKRIDWRIGSSNVSSISAKLTLKQCESFHIEKFVEEHNCKSEGDKRSSKTLMFLEGLANPLGCTILLKGASSDELKKMKRVLHYTVFAAYHLKLEASFFADQCEFFSDNDPKTSLGAKSPLSVTIDDSSSDLAIMQDDMSCDTAATMLEIPISGCDGSAEEFNHGGMLPNCAMKTEGFQEFPNCTLDGSLTGDRYEHSDPILEKPNIINIFQSDSSELRSSPFFGFENPNSCHASSVKEFGIEKDMSSEFGVKKSDGIENDMSSEFGVKKSDDGVFIREEIVPKQDVVDKDEVKGTIDPHSILILKSVQCIPKFTFCEPSVLLRIKYYGDFDFSLGQFLKDKVLNKEHLCSSCGEPPESHVYSYTHQNGNLSVFSKTLPDEILSGENEGKLWMWTRCLRCEQGIPTRRVVLSSSARKLSFGKFLELSFSGHSAASRLSKCKHSLLRDCLRFFGLGSKVAMFKYSPVKIYSTCKPPPVLQFESLKRQLWIKNEVESIKTKGRTFFKDVSDKLQNLQSTLSKHKITISGLVIDFSTLEGMLVQEKSEFENALLKTIDGDEETKMTVYEILGLRWLTQELLLELYVWDCRLHDLEDSIKSVTDDSCSHVNEIGSNTDSNSVTKTLHNVPSVSLDNHNPQDMQTDLYIGTAESTSIVENLPEPFSTNEGKSPIQQFSEGSDFKNDKNVVDQPLGGEPEQQHLRDNNNTAESGCDAVSENKTTEHSIAVLKTECLDKLDDFEVKTDQIVNTVGNSDESKLVPNSVVSENKSLIEKENIIWAPFSEWRKKLREDLFEGSLHNFSFIFDYAPSCLSRISQPLDGQMDLHFTIGPGGNILTACEDEISSIVACALAILGNKKESEQSKGVLHKSSHSMSSDSFISASSSVLDSERTNLLQTTSSDEKRLSSYAGPFSADPILSAPDLHPVIHIGNPKLTGKSKCSVICIHAEKFYSLRRKCCSSEFAYISSLSRCRKWDAQGGKSKALFAKTLDDRFIIKQIKKTELHSFLKFPSEYFDHVLDSLNSGSQTCLAKIFGIYQVRQIKNGKEVKTDLMVMENLMYGHDVSMTYDLKGAVFDRYISRSNDKKTVLLDQNFIEDMGISPIYIRVETKHLLQRAIWNDTSFLNKINVMDYSLLVGVDKDRNELVFGIIDYLRQFTWDKQLETWVKSSIVVPKNELPTIISPKEYKKRFRKFMAKYFLTVPDSWESDRCSFPCKFCTNDKSGSFKVHNAELPEQSIEA